MQWAANLKRRLAFRHPEFTPTRKSPTTEYAAIALFKNFQFLVKSRPAGATPLADFQNF